MPRKPADFFAPAVLGKMLEDRLKGAPSAPVDRMGQLRGDLADDEHEPEVEDVIGTPLGEPEEVVPGLPPVRRPRMMLPQPLEAPVPRFVRGAQADRWEPK